MSPGTVHHRKNICHYYTASKLPGSNYYCLSIKPTGNAGAPAKEEPAQGGTAACGEALGIWEKHRAAASVQDEL